MKPPDTAYIQNVCFTLGRGVMDDVLPLFRQPCGGEGCRRCRACLPDSLSVVICPKCWEWGVDCEPFTLRLCGCSFEKTETVPGYLIGNLTNYEQTTSDP